MKSPRAPGLWSTDGLIEHRAWIPFRSIRVCVTRDPSEYIIHGWLLRCAVRLLADRPKWHSKVFYYFFITSYKILSEGARSRYAGNQLCSKRVALLAVIRFRSMFSSIRARKCRFDSYIQSDFFHKTTSSDILYRSISRETERVHVLVINSVRIADIDGIFTLFSSVVLTP